MMLACMAALTALAYHEAPDAPAPPPHPVILAQLGEIPEVPNLGPVPSMLPPLRLDEFGDIPEPSGDVPWIPIEDFALPLERRWCEVGDGRGCEVQGAGLMTGGNCTCQVLVPGRIAE